MPPASSARANQATVAALARMTTQIETLTLQLNTFGAVANETHDEVIKIKTTMVEQNVGVRIQALDDRIDLTAERLRSDLVNAISRMREEGGRVVDGINAKVNDHEKRIDALETLRDKAAGSGTILGWLGTHGLTILVSALTAVAAFLGLRITSH